jgi:hypothetical protein
MNEKNARLILTVAGSSATAGFVIAIILAIRGEQGFAIFFLAMALLDSVVAWMLYRQYMRLRAARWDAELQGGREEMDSLIAGEAKKEETAKSEGETP